MDPQKARPDHTHTSGAHLHTGQNRERGHHPTSDSKQTSYPLPRLK